MTTVSFSEAAALTYIAKRKDLTSHERTKLTKGLTPRGKRIAQALVRGSSGTASLKSRSGRSKSRRQG